MKRLIAIASLTCTLALGLAACGDDASCDKVVEKMFKLMPEEMKAQLGDKKILAKQCKEKLSEAERKCAVKADNWEAMLACKKG